MMTWPRTTTMNVGAGVLLTLLVAVSAGAQQQAPGTETPAEQATPPAAGPIAVETVRHVNSSLVLFDEFERRYVIEDGSYLSDEGVRLEISNGRIGRFAGCGENPCDFTVHATRVVERRLLLYAELAIPDGLYRHDGGSWFRIEDGELVEFLGGTPAAAAAPEEGEDVP